MLVCIMALVCLQPQAPLPEVPAGSVTLARAAYRSMSGARDWRGVGAQLPVALESDENRAALKEVVAFGLARQKKLDRGVTLRMMRVDAKSNLLDTANAAIAYTGFGALSTPLAGLAKAGLKYEMIIKNRARESEFLAALSAALKTRTNSSESLRDALQRFKVNPSDGAQPLTREAHSAYVSEVAGLAAVTGLSPKAKALMHAEALSLIAGLVSEGRVSQERIDKAVASNSKKLVGVTNQLAVEAEFRVQAQEHLGRLEEKMEAWEAKLKELGEMTQEQFSELRAEVDVLGAAVVRVSDQARDNFGRINTLELQQRIQQAFNTKLTGEVLKNTGRINYNQDLIYTLLSPEQRIAALADPGFMPHRSTEWKREQLEEQTGISERVALAKEIQGIQAIANGAYQIAINLGLEGKDAERASEALTWINAAASVGMAYAAPSPQTIMNALVGVSALFGGGPREDPQFKAIMEQFAAIHQSLQVISRQIETVQKNQALIMERLVAFERRLNVRLDIISRQLGDVYQLQKDHVSLDIHTLLGRVDRFDRIIDRRTEFAQQRGVALADQWGQRARHYAALGAADRERMWGSIAEMEDLLTKRPFHAFWRLSLWVERDPRSSDYSSFEDRAFAPLIRRCLDAWGARPVSELVHALNQDDGNVHQMRAIFLYRQDTVGGFEEDGNVREQIGRLLNAEAVVEYALRTLEARHYMAATLEDTATRFLSPQEFLSQLPDVESEDKRFTRRQRILEMLESSAELLDISLAQQQLLSGTYSLIPLEWPFRGFLKGEVDTEIESALQWNSLLAHNLAIVMIRAGAGGVEESVYREAWRKAGDQGGEKTRAELHAVLPGSWKKLIALEGDPATAVVGLRVSPKLWIPLPSPTALDSPLARPRAVSDLRHARALVGSALDEFKVMSESSEFSSSVEARRAAVSLLVVK